MIFLNSQSKIISDSLNLDQSTPLNRLDRLDLTFEDHSGGHFHLYARKDPSTNTKTIRLAARIPAWTQISQDTALVEIIKKEFPGLWCEEADDGFNVTLSVPLESINRETINRFANLKQIILSAPIARVISQLTKEKEEASTIIHPFTVNLGNGVNDFYSVTAGANRDQLIILFGISFADQTDTILAKVFLQEFYDVRNNRMEDAPVVLYGREPPKELANHINGTENMNYLTLVLFPRHYSTQTAQEHLLSSLPFLSDYLHYHLKCSKAYLHQRMRAKTNHFLKLLNRAKPQNF